MRATKKKTGVLVAGTAVLALTGGAAFAYFTSGGEGSASGLTGTSQEFVVSSGAYSGPALLPGVGAQTVPFTVTNPEAAGHQKLSLVTVAVKNADGSAWTAVPGCSAADYSVSVTTAPLYGDMAPGAALTGTATLTMNNLASSQDGCQGAPVPLYFLAS